MVKLKIKVSNKGQILIPKIFRDEYGIEEGGQVIIEPTVEGLLIKGKPSLNEIMNRLKKHIEEVKKLGASGPSLGELKKIYLEMEFEEKAS
ncbi:MAG: AbrB/MazE/SpoVT family DNA-binding domain-containing protein [Candidatus Bathyarchaeia archaeon]